MLGEKILNCLKEHGWNISEICPDSCVSIWCRPMRNEVGYYEYFKIDYDGSDENFTSSVKKCAETFDVYAFTELHIEKYGGLPKRLADMIDDGLKIREKINTLADALSGCLSESRNYAFEITEHMSKTVIVRADSFERACDYASDLIDLVFDGDDFLGRDCNPADCIYATGICTKGNLIPTENGLVPEGADISGYDFYDCSKRGEKQ